MSLFVYCAYFALFLAHRAAAQVDAGCFVKDSAMDPSLTDYYNYGSMTHDACRDSCGTTYVLIGLSTQTCYCSNDATSWSNCDSACSTPCSGDAGQLCGSSTCLTAVKAASDCTGNDCQEPALCTETPTSYECHCAEGESLQSDMKTCEIPPVDPPVQDPLRRCKESYLYFARHLKKCRSVSYLYPNWERKHRKDDD